MFEGQRHYPLVRHRDGSRARRARVALGAAALSALFAVSATPSTLAADGTWNGLAEDGLWQTAGNWVDGIVPGGNGGATGTNTDTATFLTNPSPPVTDPPTEWALVGVDANRNVKNITFASTTISFRIGENSYNTGNTLYLSDGGLAQTTGNTAGINGDFHAPLQFTGSTYTFLNNSTVSATLRPQGNITASPTGTTLTLDGTHGSQSSSQAEINGALLDNPLGGALSVIKQGTGTWEVNADQDRPSTYSGDTIINGGILRSSQGSGNDGLGGFSPNSHYIVNDGGTLRNSVTGTTIKKLTVNFGGLVTVSSSASTRLNVKSESGPAITLDFAANTHSSPIVVNAPFGLTGTTPMEGGLTLLATPGPTGAGPVTVVGSSQGFFDLGGVTRVFDIGQGSSTDYDLRVQGRIDGSDGFVKRGPGTLRFSGPSTSPMTGGIDIQEGTFNPSVAQMFTAAPTLRVSGGTLKLQSGHAQTFGAVTVTRGEMTGGDNLVSVAAPSFALDVGGADTARLDVILADGPGGAAGVTKTGAGTATVEISPTYTGPTTVNGGTLAFAASLTSSSSLDVTDGTLQLRASGTDVNRAIKTGAVSITGNGRLDLTQNKLITTTAPGTATAGVYDGLQRDVQRAYNFTNWDQPGLTTSQGDAQRGLTTIGISTGKQIRGLGETDTALWGGQTITGASTLAMYTYAGDANLDGQIDAGDYGIIDNFVQVAGASGYGNGDFNYDGFIDAGDYGIIDNNVQAQQAPFPTSGSAAAGATLSGVTAVPEPASLGAVAFAAAGLLRRRRRGDEKLGCPF